MNYRKKPTRRQPINKRSRYNQEKTKKEKILLIFYKQIVISVCIFICFVGLKVLPFVVTKNWIKNINESISYQVEWQQVYYMATQLPAFKTWVEEQWTKEKTIEGSEDTIEDLKEESPLEPEQEQDINILDEIEQNPIKEQEELLGK